MLVYLWHCYSQLVVLTAVTDVVLELLLLLSNYLFMFKTAFLVSGAHDDTVSRKEEKPMCNYEISSYLYFYTLKKTEH